MDNTKKDVTNQQHQYKRNNHGTILNNRSTHSLSIVLKLGGGQSNFLIPCLSIYVFIIASLVSETLVPNMDRISCFQDKYFLNHDSEELVYGIVMFIMGIAFVIQGANSLEPIGTTWAIIGIFKASKSLNQTIQQINMKEQFIMPLMLFLIRITLALLLLFDSLEKLSTHIVILGLELVVISTRFKRSGEK